MTQFAVGREKQRSRIFEQALAVWAQKNPHHSVVKRQEILQMHPDLASGNNRPATAFFRRGFLICNRRGGPKSAGDGIWKLSADGRAYLNGVHVTMEFT